MNAPAGRTEASRDALARLRGVLEEADYTDTGVAGLLGTDGVPMPRRVELPLFRHRMGDGRLATLVRLFLFGEPVGANEVAAIPLDGLGALGLLRVEDGQVTPTVRITPWDGQLFLHDPDEPGEQRADFVTGVNPASRTLANLTVTLPAASALDLGTGCGVQALRAARHTERVVATDVNERALRYVALNAALNGLANVEPRLGTLFEPVEGQRFDLIVTNPPYVISPDMQFVFRDGGGTGDAFCRGVVEAAPRYLREGGFATILCNWIVPNGQDPTELLARWVRDDGCDAFLLHYSTQDPLSYAHQWNAPLQTTDPATYAANLDRWLAYYRRNGVDAIAAGAIVMRRRDGSNWIRAAEMPLGAIGQASDHIARLFAAADFLASLPERDALLDVRFALADGHQLEQRMLFRDGAYSPGAAVLTPERGVGVRPAVDGRALPALFALDGRRSLREICADEELDPGLVLGEAERLLQLGLLTPSTS